MSEERFLEYLKRTAADLRQVRRRLREVEGRGREPVAIVGIGCRFPGGADSPAELWDVVSGGVDAISGFPVDRGWDTEGLYDPDPEQTGTSYVRQGGFVRDVAEFDPGFFGVSPREAFAMDPQQRMLLEVCWEALERAGIDPVSLRGSATGIFAGAAYGAYGLLLNGQEASDGFVMAGNATSVLSGRVSYVLGLEGPAMTVDTACSSSLVTLHLACQALRAGECDLALAGGVTVMASPEQFVAFSGQRALAPDGRCKSFGAAADGLGWAEGAGMVVVERLSDARRNGHPVLAVVVGSAVNQDGASNGLSAPNGPSQQRVIRAALAAAGVSTDQVDAVEAHGTGTVLGDPIEAQALIAVYGQGRPADRPLWLGSVKSNIGHTQQTAGVAGVIKMVLALQHGVLPATLHAREPSRHVDWSAGAVRLLTEAVPWPADGHPRRAGISSFGFSGTNAHLILQEAPPENGTADGTEDGTAEDGTAEDGTAEDGTMAEEPGLARDEHAGPGPQSDAGVPVPVPALGSGEAVPLLGSGVALWLVAGRSAEGLRAQAGRLREWVAGRPELDLADLGWSLATTRSVFEHRAVVTGASREDLAAGLGAVIAGEPAAGVVTGAAEAAGGAGKVVFVFPGQGGQWAGMGRELAGCCPVFAARLAECGAALAPHVGWDLEQVLAGADGAPGLEAADVVQPVLWAVMVSLAAVWQAAGVTPDAVAGHSQGEIAAATVAGILSLQDGAKVVALRSRALGALAVKRGNEKAGGAMMSVAEPAAAVRERIGPWGERLSVAAVNGPAATVVSGEPGALDELAAACEAAGVRARRVPVDYASHGPQVEALEEEIVAALAGITPGPAVIPMVSAMTGEWLAGPEAGAGYWYDSLRAPVEFQRAVQVLAGAGYGVFIEVSAHPVLTAAVSQTVEQDGTAGAGSGPVVTGTLRRDDGGAGRFAVSLAEVHVRGAAVDWPAVLGGGRRVELPTYAFQRQRFWPAGGAAGVGDVSAAGLGAVGHPLLGAAVELAGSEGYMFTGRVSVRSQPWLADHAVNGMVLLPGTAFVEMVVRAGEATGCGRIQELALEVPLVLPAEGTVRVQVVVGGPEASGGRPVNVYGRPGEAGTDGVWTRHASGRLAPAGAAELGLADGFVVWPPLGAVPVAVDGLYERMAAGGYGYGPAFRGLRAAWRRGAEVFAEVALPPEVAGGAGSFGVHPALLDAALHASALAGVRDSGAAAGEVRLPFAWTGVSVHAAGASVLRVRLRQSTAGEFSLVAADGAGTLTVSVESLVSRPVPAGQLEAAAGGLREALFTVDWAPVRVPESGEQAADRWAVIGAGGAGLAAGLAGTGAGVRVYPDLAGLAGAVAAGEPAPAVVLARAGVLAGAGAAGGCAGGNGGGGAARAEVGRVLGLVQEWLGSEVLGSARLVIVTAGAVGAGPGEGVADLAGAAVWGLVRSAQSEDPGRLVLADVPAGGGVVAGEPDAVGVLAGALGSDEPELAVRGGAAYGRRLARPAGGLVPPGGGVPWRLEAGGTGTLEELALVPCPGAAAPLAAGQVRVAVRAAGLNFRDVLIGLGMYPGGGMIGSEIAGLVTETGPGVERLAVGDRVLGLASGGFGPVAVTDARLLARIPAGWSFARAASVPVAFTTAWYGLVDLAGARTGQKLLVHAATGGVGMAAVAIGRHLGLEVYGTASGGKHAVLAAMGLDEAHIASSRDAGFEERFLAATGGAGVDVVLNALAGELTDASLRLLPRGGAFIEMGKTDLRDAAGIAQDHPGVAYRAFDLGEAGPVRLGEILGQVLGLLAAGELAALPVAAWDMRRAAGAFRFMSQARHAGKLVLTIPPDPAAPRAAGTVLITGGTGTLGALVAGHLAATGRARAVVLASRSGPAAPGAAVVAAGLAARGAAVRIAACDVADRPALAAMLARVPAGCPLTAVVHTAGMLDDGVTGSLTPDRVDAVLRPKADAAWHLHQLTAAANLDAFVLFSSAAATFGSAGQGNYAAANAYLDGLASFRRAAGLPAVSLAWGMWADATGMTGHLSEDDRARMTRGGVAELTAAQGLALLDAALGRDEPLLIPARLDVAGLRAAAARGEPVPPLWRSLVVPPPGSASRPAAVPPDQAGTLRQQLAALPVPDQVKVLTDVIRAQAAMVLGHPSAAAVGAGRVFKDLGFDSLTAVELRNRLATVTGLQLPATLVFDYPTPLVAAEFVRARLLPGQDLAPQAPVVTIAPGEPVAIVAMGCRLPGGAASPEALWELLAGRGDAVCELPADRGWNAAAWYDPDSGRTGTSYTRRGGFVTGAGDFDAGFFGISPREALAMDPQQRLLLEVCWEALERAGIDPASLRGSRTGVFAGGAYSGYGVGLEAEESEGYLLTGTAAAVISGRVSYVLGLEGPAMTVDTACSSSLVAMHLACQALRSGECELALAGGVAVMATPGEFIEFSHQRALAADGRCKAFGAAADGMGLAEGAGMVLLERLSDARRHGHPVLAVVRGSAVNQDGASNGLTAPNGPSQQRVIRAALASAGLTADQVDVVEAHGTGTALGDPIEAQALLAAYGQDRPEGRPLWLGSVKSNIGHAQAAAGVAGVIKMVLALQHGVLPATLHVDEPSPHIDWSAGQVRLLTEAVPWPAGDHPRRAGISAFGVSGTNVHAIVEEAPQDDRDPAGPGAGRGADGGKLAVLAPGTLAWPVAARTAPGLRAQAGRLVEWVSDRPELEPADVGWSLATTRSVFEHRAVAIGASGEELAAGLAAVMAGDPASGVITGVAEADGAGRAVFVFPGQGGQWAGMGRELAATSPVFAARLAECGAALAPYVEWSLEEVLAGADVAPDLDRVDVVQPVLWAVMVSLAATWQAAGVTPDAVVGHSQGEIAAAVVAGVLSLEDGARVVALRSRALMTLAGRGGMLSVAEPAAGVRGRLAPWGDRLAVVAVNGPAATVVSGEPAALAELAAACEAAGVRTRPVPVDYASHGPQVEQLRAEILAALASVAPGAARVPMVSAMTGQWLDGPEAGAKYWYDSLRAPVDFDRAVRVLAASGHRVFIEVSPHPVLTAAITHTLEDAAAADGTDAPVPVVTGTLRRDDGGTRRFLASLAGVHVRGVTVDWAAVLDGGRPVELPTYAFRHQRYWPSAGQTVAGGNGGPAGPAGGDGAGSAAEAGFWAAVDGGNLRGLARALAVDERARLDQLLPAMASWRRRERDRSVGAGWRYRVSWVPVAEPPRPVLSGTWLIMAAQAAGDLAARCARALAACGAEVVIAEAGPGVAGREVLADRIGEVLAGAGDPQGAGGPGGISGVSGVLSLLGLDEVPVPESAVVPGGLAGTLGLVQALGDAGIGAPLWLLTRGAVAVGDAEVVVSPVQAMVWGLGRVAGLEHPGRWGGLIDVPPGWDERVGRRVCAVLAGCGEDQVAIRAGGIVARRLMRAARPGGSAGRGWIPRGSVLVTGATGEVGPYLTGWLTRQGAPRVVLASRSGPAGVAAQAAEVAGAGSAVAVVACDIAERASVLALLNWIGASGPPLSAVLHAAVSIELAPLAGLGVAELAAGLEAKVAGAAVLDELTAGRGLDAFVLFSSIAGVWGSGVHGVYAAANAYLDALVSERRGRGLPATSVAWGVWDTGRERDPGMRPEGADAARLRRQGLRFLDPERALAVLGQVLADDETFVAVADVDWVRFAPVYRAARRWPLLDEIPEVRALASAPSSSGAGDAQLAGRLAGLSEAERNRVVTDLVRTSAAAVLGHASAEAIEPGQAFRDMGFDSLTAVELRDRLNTATGLRLPSTVVFDYPSAVTLARQVLRLLLGTAPAPLAAVRTVATGEPVAVVGLGCRYPDRVSGPEELWELLAAGRDAIGEFPADRDWDLAGLFDPDPDHAGTSYARRGGFVAGAGDFDAGFFGISPREALAMDPQQRLLLEVCWEAIERAGIDPASLQGSVTGVFAGASGSGYGADLDGSDAHRLTGNASSVISGRVSYVLGLEGPAVTVDTACSSSLVALHLACQALRSGECDLALGGGVAVMVSPAEFVQFSQQRALAADGRCKAFGAAADGMGLAEGAGMILLERLSDARRNGHQVLAVISGSAVNQDGASNGLTAPNGPSQQRVIRAALANAGVRSDQVDAVEGHGTGTTLGDPIEAHALLATYGQDRPADRPLWLGSVKSNIGHAQAAAGVAGVIKMVLALQHGMLPVTLHAQEPSSHVDWPVSVRLLTTAVPWAANGAPRRAGISAFGISGTNAHVILEDPPGAGPAAGDPAEGGPAGGEQSPVLAAGAVAWLVSGRTAEGLAAQAGRLAAWVTARPELEPADVGWSLATTRSVFEHRAVITGADREELVAGLAAVAAGEPAAGVLTGITDAGGGGRVVFVFPGQGGQWAGMGRELAGCCPVFAARLAQCGAALAPYVDWDLDGVLAGAEGAPGLDRVDVVQPALWAVMVSLAATWQAAGVTPDAVAGHSQGEIAAAVVAGILSLEDGAKVVALRSRALAALAGRGAMVSVAEPAAEVRDRIAPWGARLAVAAVNGPAATVVSGEPAAVAELVEVCAAGGVRTRLLPVDYASHSVQVEAIREEILAALDGLAPARAQIPMVSAMSGQWLAGPEAGAGYWYESLRAPVEFERGVRVLAGAGYRRFIEVSPHPVLTAAITQTVEEDGAADAGSGPVVTGTLRRDDGGAARFVASLAEVHVRGGAVGWAAMLTRGRTVPLPTYAFEHQRYWSQRAAAVVGDVAAAGLGAVGHPLLGAAVELAGGEGYMFTGRLSLRAQPWLADHAVTGTVLLPGTAFVEMVIRAGDAAGCGRIQELALEVPLVLPAEGAVRVQVVVGGAELSGARTVSVFSRAGDAGTDGVWTRHASGLLIASEPPSAEAAGEFAVWPPSGAVPVAVDDLYERMAAGGYGYGPAFRGLRAAWRREPDVFAEVALPPEAAVSAGSFGVHPALLDAALHASALADPAEAAREPGIIRLPFAWSGVSLYAAGASVLRVRMRQDAEGVMSLAAADGAGVPVVSVESLVSRPVAAGQLEAAGGLREALFTVEWVPVGVPAGRPAAGRWAVVGAGFLDLGDAGAQVRVYPDLDALAAAAEAGEPVPEVVLAGAGSAAGAGAGAGAGAAGQTVAGAARAEVGRVLGVVQAWLGLPALGSSRLVVVTAGAVATGPGEGAADLAGAAVWGLVRSAQSENPGRLMLADLSPGGAASAAEPDVAGERAVVLAAALGAGEPEVAVRGETVYGRRLARPAGGLVPPDGGGPWHLEVAERGSLDGLALLPFPAAAAPLAAGQVRVAVRAAGLNFRDVVVALGLVAREKDPGAWALGSEISGVVAETGPGVTGLAVGDRVLGLAGRGFGPVVTAEARVLARIPAGWSFARAASVPVAFTTAWYGLVDLAHARPGQRLLVHAAAGGVGMAAVAIGRQLGLEVYGTASVGKWATLAAMGLDEAHVASSRDTGFEQQFLAATGGAGMDIVLNALAGELTDASLRLLPDGGTFLEMGKTDLRDPGQVTADHPGVAYRAFSTSDAGVDRIEQVLGEVMGLLTAGKLALPPVRCWDVRRAREAFRFMSQARHTGKIVLMIPPDPAAPRPAGTVLVTGGTGVLGALVAGHLAGTGRARGLVLAGRSGPAAPGVAALAAGLAGRGTAVQVAACDAADRGSLAGLLATVPAAVPLTGVIHAAGVLDDGVTESLTPDRVDAVMRPKADAAWNLHQLTQGTDLDAFVLFSSAAATFGGFGQGNYAAGNGFLDGLAAARQAAGLPAISLAWGLWADASSMTGHLGADDLARMARGGVRALTAREGLALLDAALGRDEALLVPARLDVAGLRAQVVRGGEVGMLWRGLVPLPGGPVREPAAPASGGGSADGLRRQLAALAGGDRDRVLADLVRGHAAAVLGHRSAERVGAGRAFKDLGFDSLTALELRNRLNSATGLRLPATLIFDCPTPGAVAGYLRAELVADEAAAPVPVIADLDQLESALSAMPAGCDMREDITSRLQTILSKWIESQSAAESEGADIEFESATPGEVFDFLDEELGSL